MIPILIAIILFIAVAIWFLLAPLFSMIGSVVGDFIRQAKNAVSDKDIDNMN